MQRVFNYFFFTCLVATRKILLKEENRVGRWDRILLRMHTTLCPPCREFEKQNSLINKALNNYKEGEHLHIDLDEERIKEWKSLINSHQTNKQ